MAERKVNLNYNKKSYIIKNIRESSNLKFKKKKKIEFKKKKILKELKIKNFQKNEKSKILILKKYFEHKKYFNSLFKDLYFKKLQKRRMNEKKLKIFLLMYYFLKFINKFSEKITILQIINFFKKNKEKRVQKAVLIIKEKLQTFKLEKHSKIKNIINSYIITKKKLFQKKKSKIIIKIILKKYYQIEKISHKASKLNASLNSIKKKILEAYKYRKIYQKKIKNELKNFFFDLKIKNINQRILKNNFKFFLKFIYHYHCNYLCEKKNFKFFKKNTLIIPKPKNRWDKIWNIFLKFFLKYDLSVLNPHLFVSDSRIIKEDIIFKNLKELFVKISTDCYEN